MSKNVERKISIDSVNSGSSNSISTMDSRSYSFDSNPRSYDDLNELDNQESKDYQTNCVYNNFYEEIKSPMKNNLIAENKTPLRRKRDISIEKRNNTKSPSMDQIIRLLNNSIDHSCIQKKPTFYNE